MVSATTWQKRLNLATNRTRADTGDTRHAARGYWLSLPHPQDMFTHLSFHVIGIFPSLYILNYIQIDCVCVYVTCFLWSQVLECVLQGVPENINILPGLDNKKPMHCFQASSGPSTVQFLSVSKPESVKRLGKNPRRARQGAVCLDRLVTYTVACSRVRECWIFGACAGYG